MASYFERHIDNAVSAYLKTPEFKRWLSKRVKWTMQGFDADYKLSDRERFTETVAKRIRAKARCPIYFLGFRIWRGRLSWDCCREEADRIVTDFLRDERIKFGDPAYDWSDGADLADDDMDCWEACP